METHVLFCSNKKSRHNRRRNLLSMIYYMVKTQKTGGMDMAMMIWLLLCVFIGYCANTKGRNMWAWGIASLVFSPVLVGIVLALMPDNTNQHDDRAPHSFDESDEDDMVREVRCPECGYLADAGEHYCPRCGEMLW